MLHVSVLVLSLAALPPERDVAPVVRGPNPQSTGIAQLVPRPGGFFALHQDERTDDDGQRLGFRGARLDAALDTLDPSGIALPMPRYLYRLAGAWDGGGIALAWVDQMRVLQVARVAEDGALLRAPVTIATLPDAPAGFAAAHDGSRTIVAWIEEGSTSSLVRAASVDASGAIGGPWTLADAAVQDVAAAASNGVTLIAWAVYRAGNAATIEGVRVAAGMAPPASGSVIATRAGISYLDVTATTGGAWFVAWSEVPAPQMPVVLAAPLSAAGVLGAPVEVERITSMYAINPRVAFSGSDVRVLWTTYLDVRARTVPLSGAPSSPVQVLRSALAYEPGASVACSGLVCAAEWGEPVPGQSLVGAGLVTRLSATSAQLDVPPKEISFPADAHGPPRIADDGTAWDVLFDRRVGRSPPEVAWRRLDRGGAWLDAGPAIIGTNRQLAALAEVPGGVLVGVRAPFLDVDNRLYGVLISSSGAAGAPVTWTNPRNRPTEVHLACGNTRCGLLYEQSQGLLPITLDLAGNVVATSNVFVPFGSADYVSFRGVRGSLVAVAEGFQAPLRAWIAADTAFPTFGAPIALETPSVTTNGDFRRASIGAREAIVWSERNTCKVVGRVLDVAAARAVGTGVVELHDCTMYYASAVDVLARGNGYAVLFVVSGARGGASFKDYYVRDTDADLMPLGPARLVDSRPGLLQGLQLHAIAGRDVYTYARFDDAPGVGARRGKLAGLDAPDGGVDAGTRDAGGVAADAGGVAGDTGIGAGDAGSAGDAGGVAGDAGAGAGDAGGVAGDAGAGAGDAGAGDAMATDALTHDAAAGARADARAEPTTRTPRPEGCSCATVRTEEADLPSSAAWLGVLGRAAPAQQRSPPRDLRPADGAAAADADGAAAAADPAADRRSDDGDRAAARRRTGAGGPPSGFALLGAVVLLLASRRRAGAR